MGFNCQETNGVYSHFSSNSIQPINEIHNGTLKSKPQNKPSEKLLVCSIYAPPFGIWLA
jgi:hypothetical protein